MTTIKLNIDPALLEEIQNELFRSKRNSLTEKAFQLILLGIRQKKSEVTLKRNTV